MAKKESSDELLQLLRIMLIVQLAQARFSQKNIREIVGCSMNLVSEIVKKLPSSASN